MRQYRPFAQGVPNTFSGTGTGRERQDAKLRTRLPPAEHPIPFSPKMPNRIYGTCSERSNGGDLKRKVLREKTWLHTRRLGSKPMLAYKKSGTVTLFAFDSGEGFQSIPHPTMRCSRCSKGGRVTIERRVFIKGRRPDHYARRDSSRRPCGTPIQDDVTMIHE